MRSRPSWPDAVGRSRQRAVLVVAHIRKCCEEGLDEPFGLGHSHNLTAVNPPDILWREEFVQQINLVVVIHGVEFRHNSGRHHVSP